MDSEIIVAGDQPATIRYAAQHFLGIYQQAMDKRGSCAVVLAGGSTPQALFRMLASAEFRDQISWSHLHLFWGDERPVPADHPDSNYRLAMEAGLQLLPIPKTHLHPIPTTGDLTHCASQYATLLHNFLQHHPLDLIMLGMGSDGHIASLFPFTTALDVQDQLVVANWVPQHHSWRLTLTFAALQQGQNVVLYVLGQEKSACLAEVFSAAYDGQRLPAQRVGQPENKALWIVDTAAASQLPLPKPAVRC